MQVSAAHLPSLEICEVPTDAGCTAPIVPNSIPQKWISKVNFPCYDCLLKEDEPVKVDPLARFANKEAGMAYPRSHGLMTPPRGGGKIAPNAYLSFDYETRQEVMRNPGVIGDKTTQTKLERGTSNLRNVVNQDYTPTKFIPGHYKKKSRRGNMVWQPTPDYKRSLGDDSLGAGIDKIKVNPANTASGFVPNPTAAPFAAHGQTYTAADLVHSFAPQYYTPQPGVKGANSAQSSIYGGRDGQSSSSGSNYATPPQSYAAPVGQYNQNNNAQTAQYNNYQAPRYYAPQAGAQGASSERGSFSSGSDGRTSVTGSSYSAGQASDSRAGSRGIMPIKSTQYKGNWSY